MSPGIKSTYQTKVRKRRRRSVGTTVGNDAIQLSLEEIGVVKEPGEAVAAWLRGEGVGEEDVERWWWWFEAECCFSCKVEEVAFRSRLEFLWLSPVQISQACLGTLGLRD